MNYDDRMREKILRWLLWLGARLLTGARAVVVQPEPASGVLPAAPARTVLYFANHVSHGDFVLVWAVLDARLRERTRPVAAAEYWNSNAIKRYIGRRVVRALLIEREREKRTGDPVEQMAQALDRGESLILFPEGTRNLSDATLLPFKSGLFHVAMQRPDVRLQPVFIDNLHRVLPKGELIPIPLLCTVYFGPEFMRVSAESKQEFLHRAQSALAALKPT